MHGHCPKKLERGIIPQGVRMTFIQLLVYLHFAKFPFAARRLFELHKENARCAYTRNIKFKKHGFDMLACQTVLF